MTKPLVVISVVGLSQRLLGENTPHLNNIISRRHLTSMQDVFPAVTTTAQACMLTGKMPSQHGIVGNGWYFRELAEIMFWKQANALVESDKVWHQLRASVPGFTCSKLFWWYNMYASVDWSMTPRPHYLADGGKVFDVYSSPAEYHKTIEAEIGAFPFFNFWGPKSGIESSRWIAQAALLDFKRNKPSLQLVYLPHLDYNLQKLGPQHPGIAGDLQAIDAVVGELVQGVEELGGEVLIVSEYGITSVDTPIHINRILRKHGYIAVRNTLDFENLDAGASRAFAVSDHQCAHIYVANRSDIPGVKKLLQGVPGIEQVLDGAGKKAYQMDHARSGDLVAIAEPSAWFTYYFWLDDRKAPDYARTVDIHRKPGYDPVELFIDPSIKLPTLAVAKRLLKKKLGMRTLMDVIPLDAELVKGSHGRCVDQPEDGPLLICPQSLAVDNPTLTDVRNIIERHFAS